MNWFGGGSAGADSAYPATPSTPYRAPYMRGDSLPRDGYFNDGYALPHRSPIPISVDRQSFGMGAAGGYGQNTQFGDPRRVNNFGDSLTGGVAAGSGFGGGAGASSKQMAPNFLFGDRQDMRRRSFALPGTPKPTGITSPGILRSREDNISGTSSKSVSWSPELVREFLITPRKKSADSTSTAAAADSNDTAAAPLVPFNSTPAVSGPPLRSLYREMEPPAKQPRVVSNQDSAASSSFDATEINGSARAESAAADTDYWITVSGFPPDKLDFILDLFSRHGNVVAHKKPSKGNWVHLGYSSLVHVQQALARSGKAVDDMLLGVFPCTEPEIIGEGNVNANLSVLPAPGHSTSATVSATPRRLAPVQRTGSLKRPFRETTPVHTGMRPLRTVDNNNSVDTVSSNGTSFLGKLWNFVTTHP